MQDEDLTLDHQLPAQQLEAAMQMQAVDADAVTIADEFPAEVIEQPAAEATEVEVQTPRSDAAPASVAVLAQALGAES